MTRIWCSQILDHTRHQCGCSIFPFYSMVLEKAVWLTQNQTFRYVGRCPERMPAHRQSVWGKHKEMKKEVWIIWQMQPVPFRAVQWARFFKQMRKDALCKCLYRCVLFETPSETKSIKVWKPMETRWSIMWAFAPLVIQKFFMHWAGSIRVWCASVCLIAVLDGMHLFSYHLSSASQDMSFVIAIC